MLSGPCGAGVKAYRDFMRLENEATLLDVYDKKILPSILGSKAFVRRIREQFFTGQAQDEIPQSRESAPEPGQIKQVVCAFYHVDVSERNSSNFHNFRTY